MGGLLEDLASPFRTVMRKDLKLHGKWMYSREDTGLLVKMIEIGILGLEEKDGISVVGSYPLDKWQEAFDMAAKNSAMGQIVLLNP
jgi:hypothetical protein